MWLRVQHTTTFTYETPISEAYTELRLRPLDTGGQRCSSFRLTTVPAGVRVREYRDHLGNVVNHFDVLEAHDRLVVTARSDIFTPVAFGGERETTPLELYDYLQPTSHIALAGAVLQLAEGVTSDGSNEGTARALMTEVHGRLQYKRGATTVQTGVDEVLALGRGVCQDFAHVLIAACRCRGIPARYVSGYAYDPSLPEAEVASHAWVDIFDADKGWLSLDPTYNLEPGENYVRVAVGRDYGDVPPTRGVFKGATQEELTVKVEVRPL